MLKRITAPTGTPVTVNRAKQRLQIDVTDFDDDLTALINAAVAAVEYQTGQCLQRASWEYRMDHWPWSHPWFHPFSFVSCRWHFCIPAYPVRNVTGITYVDEEGQTQTVDADQYSWERTADGADVAFVSGFSFPVASPEKQLIRVAFDAGYDDPGESGSGDDAELIFPPQAEMAILFLVGHWFRSRESVTDAQPYTVPQTFDLLAQQLRIFR